MLNCDLAAISCSDINFSGCTFGWSENSTDVDVATRFAKKIQNCDMKACSFNGFKFTGDWIKARAPLITRPVYHSQLAAVITSVTSKSPLLLQVNLHGMRCTSATFKTVSFTGCCMLHSEFDQCSLSSSVISACALTHSQWRSCKLSGDYLAVRNNTTPASLATRLVTHS
jgi:uncharacterized protein YjbI with pentapeptide repeats